MPRDSKLDVARGRAVGDFFLDLAQDFRLPQAVFMLFHPLARGKNREQIRIHRRLVFIANDSGVYRRNPMLPQEERHPGAEEQCASVSDELRRCEGAREPEVQ